MSAGTGIRHSEHNLEAGTTRIFQIWILPNQTGKGLAWGTKPFPKGDRSHKFVALASGFADDEDALPTRADARVLGATLKAGESMEYNQGDGRYDYLVPASDSVEISGVTIETRDGAAIRDEPVIRVTALEDAELVLVGAARPRGPPCSSKS